jgi:protein involved in polysaccharide export with SLBB domain
MSKRVVRGLFVSAVFAGVCLIGFGAAWSQVPGVQNLQNFPIQPGIPGAQIANPGQQTGQPQPGQNSPPGQAVNPANPGGQQPSPFEQQKAPPSRLEAIYSSRLPVRPEQNDTKIYSAEFLEQFGYDTFGVLPPTSNNPAALFASQNGAPQDSYILGPGDEVMVVLRGLEDQTYMQRVNRDGQIVLPKLTPIEAAGRTLADFRSDVERRVGQTYISTNAFISLGQLRQISVFITGDVRSPGLRVVSALATPLDVILASGGIAKTGSLRSVVLMRGNETRTIDLYSVLTTQDGINLGALENGDRIFVPAIQNTVAVGGLVKHPGIFELSKGQRQIDVASLINLAGGFEIGGTYRLSRVTLQPDGGTQVVPVANDAMVTDGEILLVDNARDLQTQTVALRGAVRQQNVYPLASARTLRQLIRNASDLTPEAYTAFALIARRDTTYNTRVLVPVSLSKALSGQQDVPLQADDVVVIFNHDNVRDLASNVAKRLGEVPTPPSATPGTNPLAPQRGGAGALIGGQNPGIQPIGPNGGFAGGQPAFAAVGLPGLQGLPYASAQGAYGNAGYGDPSQAAGGGFGGAPGAGQQVNTTTNFALAQAVNTINREVMQNNTPLGRTTGQQGPDIVLNTANRLAISDQLLSSSVGENLVWMFDEVKDPGPYLAAPGTSLGELVQMAGGPLRTADLSAVEVTSTNIDAATGTARTIRTEYKGTVDDFRRVILQPLDVVRFRPVFSDRQEGRVTITGEVRYPGTFDVKRGERLSSVLARAGGLTDEAYAVGAIFTRRSAAIAESEANQREAKELQVALAAASQRGSITSNISGASVAGAVGGGGSNSSDVVNNLINELRVAPALGRITVTADPAVLQVHAEQDIAMEGGDTLYIPKRPSTVTVTGEVLNTGSFSYRNDLTVKDYIAMAGGTRETADEGRTFVVLPDGSARPVEESWFSFNASNIIPPGSTIVIPVAVAPFNFLSTLGNLAALTQITSQIAITAVSLKLLGQ